MGLRVVESIQHFVFTSRSADPAYVCTGKCKRVFWLDDFVPEQQGPVFTCQSCGGAVRVAVQGSDFSFLSPLQYAKLDPGCREQMKDLQALASNGSLISVHWVKLEFVDLAKREWCPNGLVYTAHSKQ